MNTNGFHYLACPYAHDDFTIMRKRYNQVTEYLNFLVNKNTVIFSPITHNHYLEIPNSTWESHWKDFDFTFLRMANSLIVLQLEGWGISEGLTAEIELAKQMGLMITYVNPNTFEESDTPYKL